MTERDPSTRLRVGPSRVEGRGFSRAMSTADTQFSKVRLEMLCDGIFAIAMTLLVLELKPPDVGRHASSAEILAGLREHVPPIVGFVMSFILAGQFWLLHHISLYQPFSFLLSMC